MRRDLIIGGVLVLLVGPAIVAHFADHPFVLSCEGIEPERCEDAWREAARQMRAQDSGIGPVTYARFRVWNDGCESESTVERGTFTFGVLATHRLYGIC